MELSNTPFLNIPPLLSGEFVSTRTLPMRKSHAPARGENTAESPPNSQEKSVFACVNAE
ncbi:hypothetical protein [Slackia faecicanis]|uniref:hypothetical protein n=1 Tax=Slackia faecicanis TaxID=255723 RepID=UPI001B8754B8|nr:hypothetical protein [Slackia faecicanis]